MVPIQNDVPFLSSAMALAPANAANAAIASIAPFARLIRVVMSLFICFAFFAFGGTRRISFNPVPRSGASLFSVGIL